MTDEHPRLSDPDRDPMQALPTALIRLSPNFLAKLKKIAPKKNRSKLWYVALFAIPAVITFAIVHAPTRRFIVAHVKSMTAAPPTVIAEPMPTPTPTPSTEPLPTVSVAVAPSISVTVAPSASVVTSASVAPAASSAPKPKAWVKRGTPRK